MTNIRNTNEVKGTVFDLPHAMSLPSDDCNVLLVSSRTLFFIQSFGLGEVSFESRYASSFLPGSRYVLAQTSSEFDDINDIINNYGLEVVEMTCDIVAAINGVQSAILTATSNACACGTVGETLETTSGEPGGIPPEGFGEPDPAIVDRLCKAANAINDSMLSVITELEASPVESFLTLGFGVVTGLVSAILAAALIPVVGILVVGVAGAVIGATLALLVSGVDLTSLKAAMTSEGQDLVCSLFGASSATDARDSYGQVLTGAGQSAVNVALITALLTNDVLDLLWFSTPDSEAFLDTFVPTFDCSSCAPEVGLWRITPNGVWHNAVAAEGQIGTGIVDNGGGNFTLTSVLMTSGNESGKFGLAMVSQAFLESQVGNQNFTTLPAGSAEGDVTRYTDLVPIPVVDTSGRKVIICGGAINTDPLEEIITPFTYVGIQHFYLFHTSSFSVEFSIDVPFTAC